MELQLKNSKVLPIDELHDFIKTKLEGKYTCELVHDRWNINFSAPKKCVLIKKSGIIGVGVFVNEKKNKVDVDGIVPNMILERIFFRNVLTRLLLLSSWNKLEAEVSDVLRTKLS
ncbi:hypothetical protein A3860_17550 [Niastella vici]|uniref:Uncharacterized protein n=1 Tax=Niastella vici TaxID=1703345 RepID=A0A1V9G4I1_9BACT|nr:hypothetical protein [Niastella vici]OQP65470.1 hypothetical protein A3860_17550 [Niastella vici]